MSLAFFVYLCSVLPKFGALFTYVGLLSTVFSLLGAGFLVTDDKSPSKMLKISAICSVVLMLGLTIPSEKTMYVMAGASVVQTAVESPEFSRINQKVIGIIEKQLDEYLKEQK